MDIVREANKRVYVFFPPTNYQLAITHYHSYR
jgi:hypothetical protein